MATNWFIKVRGKVQGPFSSKELRDKVRSRVVTQETEVRKEDSKWVPAISINGLFEQAGVSTGMERCPFCGVILVEELPTTCEQCKRRVEPRK